jgi:hypothetical protein
LPLASIPFSYFKELDNTQAEGLCFLKKSRSKPPRRFAGRYHVAAILSAKRNPAEWYRLEEAIGAAKSRFLIKETGPGAILCSKWLPSARNRKIF